MIFVGLGSNLTTGGLRTPQEVLEESLKSLEKKGVSVLRRSPWFRSAPIPASDQPWFVNGVAEVRSAFSPQRLLEVLHEVEAEYGRVRSVRNASRTLDLDLLDYDGQVLEEEGGLILPHPRLAERAFVLQPLAALAPAWRHPVSDLTAAEMLALLPPGQEVQRLA